MYSVLKPLIAAIALGFVTSAALASDYPNRPVSLVVPYAAGSTVDLIARTMQTKMSETLGQPIVVENRPGAGGITGASEVARASNDGYTILLSGTGPMLLSPLLATVPYDPIVDFEPINLSVTFPSFIAINSKIPAKTLKEFVELARAEPGKYSYASGGLGSASHIIGEIIQKLEGITLLHVPYPGSPQAATAVITGEASISFASPTSVVLPLAQSGELVLLGQTGTERLKIAPDVKTTAEQGMPGVTAPVWFGYYAPKGTSEEIITKLDSAAMDALKDPAVIDVLEKAGISVIAKDAKTFGAFHKEELVTWRKNFDDINLKLK